ncbi:hypothetical protein Hanom_Chr13g01186721 [Helianthus anomalus]
MENRNSPMPNSNNKPTIVLSSMTPCLRGFWLKCSLSTLLCGPTQTAIYGVLQFSIGRRSIS